MGDSWLKLKREETEQNIKVYRDCFPEPYEDKIFERCFLCHKTDVELVGKYGTYNEFGSFKGVCEKCLEILNRLHFKGRLEGWLE